MPSNSDQRAVATPRVCQWGSRWSRRLSVRVGSCTAPSVSTVVHDASEIGQDRTVASRETSFRVERRKRSASVGPVRPETRREEPPGHSRLSEILYTSKLGSRHQRTRLPYCSVTPPKIRTPPLRCLLRRRRIRNTAHVLSEKSREHCRLRSVHSHCDSVDAIGRILRDPSTARIRPVGNRCSCHGCCFLHRCRAAGLGKNQPRGGNPPSRRMP